MSQTTKRALEASLKNLLAKKPLDKITINDIADFYKYAFVGLMLDWIRKGMKEDPEVIIRHLSLLVQGNVSSALEHYRTDR